MDTTLSISNKGMFLNNDRVNLLESDFRKILYKHGISDDAKANCVIFYSYNPEETVFIQKMEIWLTKDKTPISEGDIKKIEGLQKGIGFTYNKNLKLNTTVHFESETGSEFNILTGFEFINYDCTYFKNTKIGLQCFLLFKNLPLYNEEAVQKTKRTPFSIFNIIDAGAGYLELLLNCGVNPNEGLYDDLFTPLMVCGFSQKYKCGKNSSGIWSQCKCNHQS